MPSRLRVGPLAIARVTAPTSRPKTRVTGRTADTGQCVDPATARVATSQANMASSNTITPVIAWVDRS
jgi:hypothetical protein